MANRVLPVVVVHGGAGGWFAGAGLSVEERLRDARAGAERAAARGLEVLRAGGSALDAAQAAVQVLEADPTFNAGNGSVLTRLGTQEMDAALMEGTGLRVGAVCALPDAASAISVARVVLEDGEHVLLAGSAGWEIARAHGLTPAAPGELVTAFARERLTQELSRRTRSSEPGTVGAAAIDARGGTAAATSTGGTVGKRPGRVGDTPLPGCGTYADDAGGAASATGHGESLIRVTMTRQCVDRLRAGEGALAAVRACVADVDARTGRDAGIICVGRDGRAAAAHNTPHMPWAVGRLEDAGVRVVSGERIAADQDVWAGF